jgi:hypothetical protein
MSTSAHEHGDSDRARRLEATARERVQRLRTEEWRSSPAIVRAAGPLLMLILVWVAGVSTLATAGERRFFIIGALVLASVHAATRGLALLRGRGDTERTIDDLYILFLPWLGMLMLLFVRT